MTLIIKGANSLINPMSPPRENIDMMLNSPKKAIIRMFLMVSVTFIVIKVNGFLDIYWITNLSTEAISAVSIVTPIYSIVAALGLGVGTGACVCIAYRLGKHDYRVANVMASTAIYLGLVVSIPAILFLLFGTELMFYNVDEEGVRGLTREYVIPLACGAPILILTGIVTNFLKAEGAMRAMVVCSLISIPVNAILTPVFVYVCEWGIKGASTATGLGSLVSMILMLYLLHSDKHHIKLKLVRPTFSNVKEVLGVGLPKALEEFLGGLTILVQNIILISKLGGDAVAIHGLTFSLMYLFTILSDSMSAATQPVCSTAAGAHRIESMRSSMIFSTLILIGLSLLVVLFLELFTPEVVQFINGGDAGELEEEMILAVGMYALMLPFYLLSRLASTLLQVLRKAHVWAPIFLVLSNIQVALLYFFATDIESMLIIVAISTSLLGIVGYALCHHYAVTYDPDAVERMIDNGEGVPRLEKLGGNKTA